MENKQYTIIQVGNWAGRRDGEVLVLVDNEHLAIEIAEGLYDEEQGLFEHPWDGFVIVGPDGELVEW